MKLLYKAGSGMWLVNYGDYRTMLAPIAGILGGVIAFALAGSWLEVTAFPGDTELMIIGAILTTGFSMFPFIMPSSPDPRGSLTVWDSTSSQMTLETMLVAAIIFPSIALAHTSWAYAVMRGEVKAAGPDENRHTLHCTASSA